MTEIYILHLDRELKNDEYDKLMNYIPEQKRERIRSFRFFIDAQRSLLGDTLSRYGICKRSDAKNKDLLFEKNSYGKPFLVKPSGIHFNISHSGHWVVCAVSDEEIGIDVEAVKPIDLKIAERFFSPDETQDLMNQPEEDRLKYFYIIWSLKEAYIKAEGKGLSIPLDSFSMKTGKKEIHAVSNGERTKYGFFQSFLGNDASLAVCTTDHESMEVFSFNIDRFLEETHSFL